MDTMDVIEVDPKLFVTCRLCLEDLGQYQIVPRIQQQIKYCYNIDVLPFDGLPQLICMKCKEILNNFYTVKTTLCEKQTNLRSKVLKKDLTEICNQPQQDTVSSSEQTSENVEVKENPECTTKRILHSSDSENTSNIVKKKRKKITVKNQNDKWDSTGFNKYLVCTICNRECSTIRSYLKHSRQHTQLKSTYPTIFNKSCSVTLEKIDNKPNLTGKSNIVVYNNDRIIKNCKTMYYIRYSKENQILLEDNGLQIVSENPYMKHVDTESNDSDQEIIKRPKRRKRRVLSRSSNETVVIESNTRKSISDIENDSKAAIQVKESKMNGAVYQCINIDDSSDSDQDRNEAKSRHIAKQRMEAKLGDYKIIQGIITMCVANYHRKNESIEKTDKQASTESQLKRKVLGIGRKIINRQGFNWAGMLKFMEYKNLGITWVTKALPNSNNKESNYIRIMTKLRGTDTFDDNQGWIPIDPSSSVKVPEPDTSLSQLEMMVPMADNSNQLHNPLDTAILFICSPPDPKNKLLNANPVANPKQLPKKFGQTNELRLQNCRVAESFHINEESFHINEEPDLCLPIITSTTSLAAPSVVAEHKNVKTPPLANTTPDVPAPRIKVKPVTELMSERMLNSLRKEQSAAISTSNLLQNELEKTSNLIRSQLDNTNNMGLNQINNTSNVILPKNIWLPQSVPNVSNMYVPNIVPQLTVVSQPQLTVITQPQLTVASQPQLTVASQSQLTVANQPLQLVQLPCLNAVNISSAPNYQSIPPATPNDESALNKEEVMLNTVELPNTRTNSPFKYLRLLSSIHNLTLFDPLEKLPHEFVCLIKFKVQFKQEPIDEPVVLCLSLFCFKHKFCFTVRDRNQRDININKISPNWQWEILNVFRGDLVDKLLQNAQKHSQETHDYTKKFLCLLKSISFQKLS